MHCLICGEETDDLNAHIQEHHEPMEVAEAFKQMMPDPQPSVQINRTSSFAKHYATNFHTELTRFDIRFQVMNERFTIPPGPGAPNPIIQFQSESMVIATPTAAKTLLNQLEVAIQEYENTFGEIEENDGV